MDGRALRVALAAIVTAMALFHLLTLREGHDWGGDFAQYIRHAGNLVEGVPYAEIGYVPNPSVSEIGPRTFPTVFPILLTPLYALQGLDLTMMKVQQVIFLVALLAILAGAFSSRLPPAGRVALVLLVGFCPFFFEMKERIMSDLPFLVFAYTSLWIAGSAHRDSVFAESRRGLAAGGLAYLAAGTRSVGLVILPCLVVADLVRARRITPRTIAAVIAFLPLMVLQAMLIHSGGEYTGSFRPSIPDAIENARVYLWSLSMLWDGGGGRLLRLALLAVTGALAALGFLSRFRRDPGVWEFFPLAYLALLMAWPLRSGRLLAPIVPLCFLFMLEGLRAPSLRLGARARATLAWLVGAGVLVTWGGWYASADLGPFREGVARPETIEMFTFVRNDTPPESVFVFRKPRVLSLYTGRRATIFHDPTKGPDLESFLREAGVTYLIAGPGDPAFWKTFLADRREGLDLVFANRDFEVFRIPGGGG